MRLQAKTAIVTGAGSGFGEGIARAFAAEGARVVVADIDGRAARRVADDIARTRRGAAKAVPCDVAREPDCALMFAAVKEWAGGLDILVNNAGVTHRNKPMLEVGEDEFDHIFAVNVKSIFLAMRHAVPALTARGGGVVINTASTAAMRPRPGLTWYNASKGAVVTATKSMALELAHLHIRVNALCPVMGETGLLETFMGTPDTPEARARFIAGIPLGRLSTPADIAAAAVFLASEEASFVTGVALEIDGGRCV
jgi:3-oxoacyl-[acyl-carrier protein] reductase